MHFLQINGINSSQPINHIQYDYINQNKMNYVLINEILNSNQKSTILQKISNNEILYKDSVLKLPDGYFIPYPYSTIHEELNSENILFNNYFNNAKILNNNFYFPEFGLFSDLISNLLNLVFNETVVPLKYQENEFAKFGIRNLFCKKNGIDIHCENSFLNQLSSNFRLWIESKVDIKNSLSFFLILQKPDKGGELMLFNKFWDDFHVPLSNTSYEERHDINGSLFYNNGERNLKVDSITIEEGSGIIFPAAQRWHAINKIEGEKNRISIGCFIARGHDGKLYFWA